MYKTTNWGIIGLGKIARTFAQDLAILPQARLQAVASRSRDKAEAFAREFGAPHAFGSYEAIVGCPGLDVVYIATPHALHRANTLLCLEAGISVLCEKPLAMNRSEAEEMIRTARDRNVFLLEALWTRFSPTTQKVLEIIRRGELGRVLSVKADFGFNPPYDPASRLFDPTLGGGSLLDIGIYPVFLAYLLLGTPEEIEASAVLAPNGVDLECGILFKYTEGQMAHLHSTFRARTKTEAFIYCEEGVVHIHPRWHEPTGMTVWRYDGMTEEFEFENPGNGYTFEAVEVMECLRQGKVESKLWWWEDSLALIGILDDIKDSFSTD